MDRPAPPTDIGHQGGVRPEATTRAPDRRVERTRRTLRDALVALILERGWDDISVKDVCAAADVGRSTFYAHFADKEELLSSGFDGLVAHLRASPECPEGTVLRFVPLLIAHTLEFRPLFRAVIGKHFGRVIQRRFRQLVVELVDEEAGDRVLPGLSREATVRFVAGGVVEVLTGTLELRSPKVDVVNAEIQALAGRLIAAR